MLARPFLQVSKSQLIATLNKAKIDFAEDPTNRDPISRVRGLRALMPTLAAEGGDRRNLARLASRLARANAAVELLVDGAERYLALRKRQRGRSARLRTSTLKAFAGLPEEIRLRLLKRAIDRIGHEGPAELGKVEALLSALDQARAQSATAQRELKQTLAGALISLTGGRFASNRRRPAVAGRPNENRIDRVSARYRRR